MLPLETCKKQKDAENNKGYSMQSKKQSLLESCVNIAIGYGVALLSQIIIFPFFDIHIPLHDNALIGLWFTAISLARSYCVRRFYNSKHR